MLGCYGAETIFVCDLKSEKIISCIGNFGLNRVATGGAPATIQLSKDGKKLVELYDDTIRLYSLENLIYLWREATLEQKLAICTLNRNKKLIGDLKTVFLSFNPAIQKFLTEEYNLEPIIAEKKNSLNNSFLSSLKNFITRHPIQMATVFIGGLVGLGLMYKSLNN